MRNHKPPRRRLDDESSTTSDTITENTSLIRSDSSSLTARDVSPGSNRSTPSDSDGPSLGWKRGTCIILSMWALIFLQAANMSGISTTQSNIAADLDSYQYAMWFTSSYMISMSSTAPLAGRLAMVFSPGVMILISAAWFSVGALITSIAPTFGVFILGRVLCGVGSGGIMTLCMILVIQLTSKRRRGLWIGITNAGFTIGVSTGAIVFGALLPVLGWRLLFGAQAPLSSIAGLAVCLSIPTHVPHESQRGKSTLDKLSGIDYLGALSLTATITLLLYGLSNTLSPVPIVLSAFTFYIFLAIERSQPDPIIPLSILSSWGVLLSCFSQLGFMAARWTVLFYAPMFVLAVRGLSPAVAGSVLIPTNLGFGIGGLLVGAFHIKRAGSFWLPALISLFFFGVALFVLSFVSNAAADAKLYVAVLFANGFFTGAALNYTLAHLLHLSSPEMHFIATGLLSTFRGFAGSFGTSIGGGVFTRTLGNSLKDGFERLDGGHLSEARRKLITVLIGSPAAVFQEGLLSEDERVVAVLGYEKALDVLYKSAAVLSIFVLVMQAGTGWAAPKQDEEEIEEAFEEADGGMEA
ncbi:a3cd8e07-eb26-4bbc-94d6-23fef38e34f5 [Podospora australis]|uniref:A3cd8e07-eb26-4bbc-94d6-23fef38e34f5 n=1 Tax=Podospora australis TaxID=1536484 RepID=A0AAN6X238_9PEZI|nr:a3cd8e07-eb26-4bbc-94d6-23fef38e34f5 [Podospora australis]